MNKIYIPATILEKIDFIILTEFNNPTEKQRINIADRLISLWFFIYTSQRENDKIWNLKGFTNIEKKSLLHFSIRLERLYNYNDLLKMLSDEKLISINNKYSVGNFSKSYRVETEFIETKYTEVNIDIEKIYKNIKNKSHWIKNNPEHKKQINDAYKASINIPQYIEWLHNNIGLELRPIFKDGILERRYLTTETIYNYINDALKINFKNIWFKVSNEGRFYNSLTNLSYTALPFIKVNRRLIKEIDVSNCQPLLLSKLINNSQYKKDCENGIFYDKISKELNVSRNEAKILSYKYIFFKSKPLLSGKIFDCMEKLYCGVIGQINELRQTMNLAIELQKIESNIFVNKIGNMDYDMMLRHDAVFVCEEDYEIIKKVVFREFNKIGLNPTIK